MTNIVVCNDMSHWPRGSDVFAVFPGQDEDGNKRRAEGQHFPSPPTSSDPPAYDHSSPPYFLLLQSERPFSPHSCAFEWLLFNFCFLPSLMFASVSSPLLLPVLKLQYLAAYYQNCQTFQKNSLHPSTYISSTIFPSNSVLGTSTIMSTLHQMVTLIRRITATGRDSNQAVFLRCFTFSTAVVRSFLVHIRK